MTEESTTDTRLQDALSPETRSARKGLLICSFVDVAVSKVGILPSKISALGIEFDRLNQKSFALLVAVLTSYFLLTFLIYGSSDFLIWRNKKRQLELQFKIAGVFPSFYAIAGIYKLSWISGAIAGARCLVDFVLPIVGGAYGAYLLLALVKTI